jgi:hypothetical protein
MKLEQHFGRFFNLLKSTGDRAIVERSRRDRFWGAVLEKDGVLRGENMLGIEAEAEQMEEGYVSLPSLPSALLVSDGRPCHSCLIFRISNTQSNSTDPAGNRFLSSKKLDSIRSAANDSTSQLTVQSSKPSYVPVV